jgi:hypothetical protein
MAARMMGTEIFATYLLGPFLALLPRRWRAGLPNADRVNWERAGTLSGLLEMLAGIVGLGYAFLMVMPRLYEISFDAADKANADVSEYHVRGAAWILFMLQPVTWLLFYVFFEGAVRMCGAAFAENVVGTLPLAIVDLILSRGKWKGDGRVTEGWDSFVASVREWMMVKRLPEVPDELQRVPDGEEEMLEIWASRRKQGWDAPLIVRVDELYYRLEETWVGGGPRPFRYRLRRLAAGVPGRRVIFYRSGNAEN